MTPVGGDDPVERVVLTPIGGPLGRRARSVTWSRLVAPLAGLAVVPVIAGIALRTHCLRFGYDGSEPFWRACYSDLGIDYQVRELGRGFGAFLSGEIDVGLPPLVGGIMSALGGWASSLTSGDIVAEQRTYLLLWALLTAGLLIVMTVAVALVRVDRPTLAAHVALSPVVVLAALVSPDIVGVTLTVLGLLAWVHRHRVTAGLVLGLALATSILPLVVVIAVVLLARRDRSRIIGFLVGLAVPVVGTVVAARVIEQQDPWLHHTSWGQPAGLGSPWYLVEQAGIVLPPVALNTLVGIGWVLALAVGVVLALGAVRRPTVFQLTFVMLVVVIVTGRSFPVQTSLWLVPLVALCGFRWRDHLVWAGAEAMYYVAVWTHAAIHDDPNRALPDGWYAVFVVIRIAAIGYLVWRVWRAVDDPSPSPRLGLVRPGDSARLGGMPLERVV